MVRHLDLQFLFQIFENYVTSASNLKEENRKLDQDLLYWRQKYEDLEGESRTLYAEIRPVASSIIWGGGTYSYIRVRRP